MRSNLLSLQNISGQVSSTQNKLATGNKVNSAIDNPSSYYTALSLNNRADDLNALLDSMGQAVSTIKAATTALESATEFLEQASAVATQALETAKIPSKSFFEEKVGANGAVVTTAQELRDAINAGKETICVYGAIDLGDISTENNIMLKENQKLVGVGYFGNYDTDTNKFSSITATANVVGKSFININKTNCVLSDLSIKYTNTAATMYISAVNVTGNKTEASLQDLDITAKFNETEGVHKSAIAIRSSATGNISGRINLNTSGESGYGIYNASNSSILNINSGTYLQINTTGTSGSGIVTDNTATTNIYGKSVIDIKTFGDSAKGIYSSFNATTNILSSAFVNIETSGKLAYGINSYYNSFNSIQSGAKINIATSGTSAYGISGEFDILSGAMVKIVTSGDNAIGINATTSTTYNISGNISIYTTGLKAYGINMSGNGRHIIVGMSAQIHLNTVDTEIQNSPSGILDIAVGAKLAFGKDRKTDWYEIKADYHDENTSYNNITVDNVKDKLTVEETSAWELPEKVEIDLEDGNSNGETAKQDLADAGKNYQEIINQYDSLIKDAGYKGINLLQNDKLSVKFNETNTADLSVQGQDMSSQALGFKTFDWQTQADIADSLAEIASALQSIRNYSSELGNNYSIITTRQDFTESLVNVLTEGADKLTLADMNEESANMLALQTRQQLAINSLSLASQASQSILKLF